LFGAVALRLFNFNESLWFDELFSTRIVLKDINHLLATILVDTRPPLYPLFMFFWINLFGDAEMSIRLPPLMFGIGSIFLTYIIVLKNVDKKAALLVAFLLCVSPVHIWYSQEARHYAAIITDLVGSSTVKTEQLS